MTGSEVLIRALNRLKGDNLKRGNKTAVNVGGVKRDGDVVKFMVTITETLPDGKLKFTDAHYEIPATAMQPVKTKEKITTWGELMEKQS